MNLACAASSASCKAFHATQNNNSRRKVCPGQWQQQACSSRGQRRWRQQQVAAAAGELSGSHEAELPTTSYSSSAEDEDVDDESREFALAMAKIAWETKAEDIMVLHVAPVVYWTRYFLIATVFSRPQLNAVLGKMEAEAAEVFDRRLSRTPQAGTGGWELLDYGDCVIHIMTAEQREFYGLESLYGAAEEVELPFDASEAARNDAASWSTKL